MKTCSTTWLWVAVLCLTTSATVAQRPNVVVILTDDQGYADISLNPHHGEEVSTPHMNALAAAHYGVQNGDFMKLRVESVQCTLVFEDLLVRADETSKLEVHIDTDEGNACYLDGASKVELLPQNGGCGCQDK